MKHKVESDVTREIVAYLTQAGWQLVRHHPIHPVGIPMKIGGRLMIGIGKVPPLEVGFPDWIAIHPAGHVFFLELKRPGEEPEGDQAGWLAGFPSLMTWADSVERLEAWLTEHNLPKGPCWEQNPPICTVRDASGNFVKVDRL